MLSVLAFKRSLSAGVLDGGTGEISLGGSRLNRFMKDVENVTGHMGEGEAMAPAEEAGGGQAVTEAVPIPIPEEQMDAGDGDGEMAVAEHEGQGVPEVTPHNAVDPWQALVQIGAQLVSALGAASNPAAPAHPWIERDPGTGVQSLKVPLPPPEVAGQIADVLSMLANTLRGQRP